MLTIAFDQTTLSRLAIILTQKRNSLSKLVAFVSLYNIFMLPVFSFKNYDLNEKSNVGFCSHNEL